MPKQTDASRPYQVTVDRQDLKTWGYAGQGYSVRLTGLIDPSWIAAFRLLQKELGDPPRFYLDRAHGVVAFTCRGANDSNVSLTDLEGLVKSTNQRAGSHVDEVPQPPVSWWARIGEDTLKRLKQTLGSAGRGSDQPSKR